MGYSAKTKCEILDLKAKHTAEIVKCKRLLKSADSASMSSNLHKAPFMSTSAVLEKKNMW